MSLEMLDDDCSGVLVFVLEAREMRNADVSQIAEEDDVKVAASLLKIAKESFNEIHGVQQLKTIC